MWENELLMFRFGFYILIGIFILLLLNLIKSHFDHKELMDVLTRLATHSHSKEKSDEQ
jgi:hypothetical protein